MTRFLIGFTTLACTVCGSAGVLRAISEASDLEAVHALFDLSDPMTGPFPSDWFTLADASHNTGRRVNLPPPDCGARPSDCEDIEIINTLDGFNLQPRLSIPFDGAIDITTVSSETVFLISLGSTAPGGDRGGTVTGINQRVWDPTSNTLHVESDELLEQHTQYALIVTRGVRDQYGTPVEPSDAFLRFRHNVRGEYKQLLLDAIHAARHAGMSEQDIATASVFTTQSATAVLERIRDQIHESTPGPVDFNLGPGGSRTVFTLDDITGITWNQQIRHSPNQFRSVSLATDLAALYLKPGAVARIAYGKYVALEYLVHPGEFIPPFATRTGTPLVQGTANVYFNVVLPAGPMPPNGWPVAIYGTGAEGTKDTWLLRVAASMAAEGIATVSINFYGRGFGPLSTISIQRRFGGPVTFLAGGRSIDQDGDGVLGGTEGFESLAPLVQLRDSYRQTVIDWIQLVRAIQAGIDIDQDGTEDLDPSRIYQFGNSTGGNMGTLLLAVEPAVRAGVLNATGGSIMEWNRLSGVAARMRVGERLARRTPSLLNSPGISFIDGVAVPPPFFHENKPLRDDSPLIVGLNDGTTVFIQSPVINDVRGAMEIQEHMERREWVGLSGDPLGYVRHLRKRPLAGSHAKSVIVQLAKGDRNIPNPTTAALLRAGELADRATLYRHDLAVAEDPRLDKNPHQFLIRVDVPPELPIALGWQSQIARFFESDGTHIIHPTPERFFERPFVLPLLDALNFIP